MSHFHKLSSEQYYAKKAKAEVIAFRRYQAQMVIKEFATGIGMLTVAVATAVAVLAWPTIVPDCIDMMRESGVLIF